MLVDKIYEVTEFINDLQKNYIKDKDELLQSYQLYNYLCDMAIYKDLKNKNWDQCEEFADLIINEYHNYNFYWGLIKKYNKDSEYTELVDKILDN